MMQEKSLYMNLATLPDIIEEILQEDNDKKEKVREDHLQEKSKSDKVQIVNDKTELSDITDLEEEEEVFKSDDKKEKVRKDHLLEKSKSEKIQIVNDKTEIKEQILQEDNDIKEKVREDHLEEKSKSDKIQIVNEKTEISEIANIEEEEEVFKNAGGDEQNKAIETSMILLIDWV